MSDVAAGRLERPLTAERGEATCVQRVDLHVHTVHSPDSRLTLETLGRYAARRGLTHVAVTDHDTLDGALRARELAVAGRLGVGVIVGEEVMTAQGEVLGLFLHEPVEPGQPLGDTVAAIRGQGGLVCLPHPHRPGRAALDLAALEPLWDQVDLVEGFNARNLDPRANRRALSLARAHRKPVVSASDAHSGWEVGRSHVCLGEFVDAPGFLAAAADATLVCRPCPYAYRLWLAATAAFRGKG